MSQRFNLMGIKIEQSYFIRRKRICFIRHLSHFFEGIDLFGAELHEKLSVVEKKLGWNNLVIK